MTPLAGIPGIHAEGVGSMIPFYIFKDLGQLSPFSPITQKEKGEVWVDKPAIAVKKNFVKIHIADPNVGTTCMLRKSVVQTGVKFTNYAYEKGSKYRIPNDMDFSKAITAHGFLVAWSDRYYIHNWGHNLDEIMKNPEYYAGSYQTKHIGIAGLNDRLIQHGYKMEEDGDKVVVKDATKDAK